MEALSVVAGLAFLYGIYHAVRAGVRDGILAAEEAQQPSAASDDSTPG